MSTHKLDYLEQLEAESIYIMREIAAQFEKPALLFSGGKDSITLVHLARKAFAPMKIPFPLVHIDTGHNFPEDLQLIDYLAENIFEEFYLVASQKRYPIWPDRIYEREMKHIYHAAFHQIRIAVSELCEFGNAAIIDPAF